MTKAEYQAAWQASSARQSCYPGWEAKSIGDKCGIYVHCKKQEGTEVANGSYNPHYDQKSKDSIGVFYTTNELRKLK